jgi:CBS domain-containing protein
MAQSPDHRPAGVNTETASQSDPQRKAQTATSQIKEGERNIASGMHSTARAGGEATQQSTHQASETLRHSGAAGAELAEAGAQIGAETARRSASAMAEGQRQLLEDVAERYEAVARRMAQTMQENAAGLRTLMLPFGTAAQSLQDLQEGMTGLVNGVVQSNVHATQRLLRLADPASVYDLQSRFVREYLDTLLQGTSAFIRVARQTAEQTLGPIEARIEERQQSRRRQGGDQSQKDHGVVADVMSSNVRVVNPEETVQQASRVMRDEDTGMLPVGEGDRLIGIVTDRDVALRLVAEGKDPTRTKVREVMSQDLKYVFEDEELAHVADNMAEQQIRRLPVVNRNKRLVGVISLGDLSRGSRSGHFAGRAMRGVARETGSQGPSRAAE